MEIKLFNKSIVSINTGKLKTDDRFSKFIGSMLPSWSRFGSLNNYDVMEVSSQGLIFTCLNYDANAIIAPARKVYKNLSQSDQIELPIDHWAVKFFTEANPVYTNSEMLPMIPKWLRINGNCFIYTPCFGGDYPLQQWILNPSRVTIRMGGGDDLISGYDYLTPNGNIFLPEKEVLHIRTFQPSNKLDSQLFGIGLVQAALQNGNINAGIADFLQRYFENDANPPLIGVEKESSNVSADFFRLYRDDWNAKFPNNKMISILSKHLTLDTIKGSALDLDFDKVKESNRQEITEIFGIPLDLLNGKLNSRATADVVRTAYLLSQINPMVQLIDDAYTKHLRQFDRTLIVKSDLYVDGDKDEKRKQELHELSTGQTTINELRARINLPAIAMGDTIFVPNNLVPIEKALAATPAPMALMAVPNPEQKMLTKSDEELESEKKNLIWRDFDRLTMKYSDVLQGQITGVFEDLEREVLGNINKAYSIIESKEWSLGYDVVLKLAFVDNLKASELEGSILFNEEEWSKALEKATNGTLTELQTQAILQSLSTVSEDYSSLPSSFSELMGNELESCSAKITDSIGTVKNELQTLLKKNTDLNSTELSKLIKTKFKEIQTSRAENIAQTSSNFTTNSAQKNTWKSTKWEYTWLSQRNSKVRTSHSKADGTKPDKDGWFYVGSDKMQHPCGGSEAKENCFCHCSLFPSRKVV